MNEQATMMNQQHQQQQHQHLMSLNQNMMSLNQMNQQPQPQMVPMNHGYGMWPQPPPFPKPNPNPGAMKPPSSSFKKSLGPRSNWKGKKVNMPNNKRRNELQKPTMAGSSAGGLAGGMGNPSFNNYQPPTLNELQHQNRMKTRKFFPKKKFNNNNTMNMNMNMIANNQNFNNSRSAPYAPRNTTSFIIRAKKSGGIASLVSPSPKTPAVLPTPIFSPSREVLVDMAKEEWGVDGYGSMKGLIRLRSPGHEMEDEDEGGSSESDVEEHVEMERRLDHDLSRFEMIYNPNSVHVGGMDYHNVLENRVDDQDSHIAQLEDENLILKERLFLIERELGDLRRRMQFLERRENRSGGEINEEVVENESENSESREGHSVEDINEFSEGNNNSNSAGGDSKEKNDAFAESDDKNGKVTDVEGKEENNKSDENNDDMIAEDGKNDSKVTDVECEEENNIIDDVLGFEKKTENDDDMVAEDRKNSKVADVKGKAENNNDEYVDANKANKCLNMEVNAVDNINILSSKSPSSVVEEGDIGMEDTTVLPRN
ncbi:hypothetical protein CASFOL_008605 [Castilleja foliolosa]|uniref:PRLI-interacting factor A n=1 Tax=Castilleja foliolosa TaxID=1961234 RepID=A0ABD3DZZ3_9LAMI